MKIPSRGPLSCEGCEPYAVSSQSQKPAR
jgi:hypothetical protein